MSTPIIATALFPMGRIVATPGAMEALDHQDILHALGRHSRGDWGDLDAEDKAENDLSLKEGFRLLSAYHGADGKTFWIITESDRRSTTILLPSEY